MMAHAWGRAAGRGVLPAVLMAVGAFSAIYRARHWLSLDREDEVYRKAGKLYRKLAEQEFGAVKVERAYLPGRVTRLVITLPGIDEDRELDDALRRVWAIHDKVESIAPELVGRIAFDYSGDARPS